MQLRYMKSVLPPSDNLQKVTALTWSPNNARLAVATTDRIVYMFDEQGERKDKFKAKPADPNGPSTFVVKSMAFSPDSTKLALAQSDNMVFVYKLVDDTGAEKKSICNKFLHSHATTTVVWPRDRPNELVFGTADGKIRLATIKSKGRNVWSLYEHAQGSYVVALSCNITNSGGSGNIVGGLSSSVSSQGLISGHADGSIYKYMFPLEEGGAGTVLQIVIHPCVPYALSWGQSIAAAGNDNKVVFYDANGREIRTFDYGAEDGAREFTSAAFNPSGDTVAVGSFNRFYTFSYSMKQADWEEVGVKQIENFYTVSSVAWKPDGSKLVVGGLTGVTDMYDACVRRHMYKGKFEFTHVSRSAVIVKTLQTGARTVLKSVYGLEIIRINVYQERYLVARTSSTLLLGNLETCKLSEVSWDRIEGGEKFHFENERVCLVHAAGELHIIEYGRNEVLGTCRTEHMSPYLVSVAVHEKRGLSPDSKKLAYLIDLQTIRIQDLLMTSGSPMMMPSAATSSSINHDTRIDWLALNPRGTHLLFRDRQRHLHLVAMATQSKSTLLTHCSFAQWVPGSDVVVAQSRNNLCVWYSIAKPENVTMFPIKGEIVEIETGNAVGGGAGGAGGGGHRTEVIVDEGISTVSYALDEVLIFFGAALEDQDYEKAADTLSELELTPETETQWQQLADAAEKSGFLSIAERCYAALGDIARTRFLHRMSKMASAAAAESGSGSGSDSFAVRSQLALLQRQWPVAENLLLAQGKVDEVIVMYQDHQRWEDAVRVAEQNRHPEAAALKSRFFRWLLETGQEEKAAAVKEEEEDYLAAINLYLKGGMPGRAAQVVMRTPAHSWDMSLLESILAALAKAELFERAGELYEMLNRFPDALVSYKRGHAYRKAIDLARREDPSQVRVLEELWGDWLVVQKQMDAAINHFIESYAPLKAIKAAMECRQFTKAAGIIDALDNPADAIPFYRRIAQHYESTSSLEEAERYYVKCGGARDAVEMYSRAGKWDAAQRVARGHLTEAEMRQLYRTKGAEFEDAHKFKEAEKAYLAAGGEDVDRAIAMYRKARMYDHTLRLVQMYRKDKLSEEHLLVAQQLEAEGSLRDAEKHFAEGKDWKSAVQMYRQHVMWEDALRVARVYGGPTATKQVAYAWALSVGGGDEGAALLKRIGLIEQAIDYAIESGAFAQAFDLARSGLKSKLPEAHLKYAMFLEDEGRFAEAEVEFVAADKAKEAVDMYIHNQDWAAALRVAEQNDPSSLQDVFVAQARTCLERKQLPQAEALFLRAKRPELALKMYRDARLLGDALRVAEDYLPSKASEIQMELQQMQQQQMQQGGGGGGGGMGGGLLLGGGGSAATSNGSFASSAAPSTSTTATAFMGGTDGVIAKAKGFERAHDYARAIEAYLSLGPSDSPNLDLLERVWEQAASLAINFQRHRMVDVVNMVSGRLQEIRRHQAAAELHESIDDVQGAIRAYCAGGLFPAARQLAGNNPTFLRFIEERQGKYQADGGGVGGVGGGGGTGMGGGGGAGMGGGTGTGGGSQQQAIEMYAQRDDWDRVHELAAMQGTDVAGQYSVRHAERLFKQGNYLGAAQALQRHGLPPVATSAQLNFFRDLSAAILGATITERNPDAEAAARDYLYRLVMQLRNNPGAAQKYKVELELFQKHYYACHFLSNGSLAKNRGLKTLAAMCYTSALRSVGVIPADRAFFEAGMAWKEAGRLSMAFVMLNRFLDLNDAMEDPDSSAAMIENSDFQDTDVPFDFHIPERPHVPDRAREDARNLVLEISMDGSTDQSLSTWMCEQCGKPTFEANLTCHCCKSVYEPCSISGYPVAKFDKVVFSANGPEIVSIRERWNEWVETFRMEPVTGGPAAPIY
uniref:Intraflagellar transport protein n=1 Tax=Polytomella parva TaxID=51329 RepID=A0A7S0YIK8_9CHLO|mmetsp:Transcript_28634/g.52641  ORF Transcript_28634/g.52641 Transcript_28634/m.52641 type:complete len:1862 (+) Transcript_28634:155-5740(+)